MWIPTAFAHWYLAGWSHYRKTLVFGQLGCARLFAELSGKRSWWWFVQKYSALLELRSFVPGKDLAVRQLFMQWRSFTQGTVGVFSLWMPATLSTVWTGVKLHNIQDCPAFATCVINYYRSSAQLFVGGETLLSAEGTTQGDPLSMPFMPLEPSRAGKIFSVPLATMEPLPKISRQTGTRT